MVVTLVKEHTDRRKAALTAGISLLVMSAAASFSYGYVHGSLIVQEDASATFHNLLTSHGLFKAEIFGWLLILICDIVVAWAFHLFLKPINHSLSLLGAWLRLIYASVLGIALLNLLFVLLLSGKAEYLSSLQTEQIEAFVMLFLGAFDVMWSIGLILFGGHLLVVGCLALKSGSIPKAIGILLLIAGTGYMVIHLCNAFLSQYDEVITILDYLFTVPMIAGELGFGLWLLMKGGKSPLKA